MIDIDLSIQAFILQQFQFAAANKQHRRWLRRKGFTEQMIDHLAALSPDATQKLIRSEPFQVTVSASLLASSLAGLNQRAARDRLAIRALKLGASRRMLNDLLDLQDSEYKRLKEYANLEPQSRHRPKAISMHVLNDLSDIHANLIRCYKRVGVDKHPLSILITLSEVTDIELNQIYESYYRQNHELFTRELFTASKMKAEGKDEP